VLVLLPIVLIIYYPEYGLTSTSVVSFIAAGIAGTVIGRAFMYMSIDQIGASRTAPVVASWALLASALGVVLLGESLTPIHGLGIVLVVLGVAVIAWETANDHYSTRTQMETIAGLMIPLAAAFAYAWEPIFANVGFSKGTPALVGTVVKTAAAVLGFTLYLRWNSALPGWPTVQSDSMRWYVFAGIANTIALSGYYVALELAPVSVVVPIIVTNTLFVVVLSAIFMPKRLESVTWRLAVATGIVVTGVVAITLFT